MAENDTLLAHLILDVRLTKGVEVAATRSLAYILNKSESAKKALVELINSQTGAELEPIAWVIAEDVYQAEGGSGRIDFVGYGANDEKRIVGEAKFDAAISSGQGGGYLHQLTKEGDAVLMFVVPDYRIDYLWGEVRKDIEETGKGATLGNTEVQRGIKSSGVKYQNNNWHLIMVSWQGLLQEMNENTVGEANIQSDIHQLMGLTERMDKEAILPFEAGELGANIGRRMSNLRRIYDDVRQGCNGDDRIDWRGPNNDLETGYGNFCYLSNSYCWFGVYYDLWQRSDCVDEPFWLALYEASQSEAEAIGRKLESHLVCDNWGRNCIPVNLRLGVERADIVDSMVFQLSQAAETIADVALGDQPI